MPSCLTRIAAELDVRVRYQGADIVAELVAQLNAGRGSYLANGTRPAVGSGVEVADFLYMDATDPVAIAKLRGRFDIMVTRHVTIHLQSEAVMRLVENWNTLGLQYVLTDDYASERNINWLDAHADFPHRELNLREPPFLLPDPECSQPDASLCEAVAKCKSNLNLFVPPLTHGELDAHPSNTRKGVYTHARAYNDSTAASLRHGRKLRFCINASSPSATSQSHVWKARARALLTDFHPTWRKLYGNPTW